MDSLVLGRRIRAHRVAAGLSLRELSSHVPVSPQALNQYEHGQTRPRNEVLKILAIRLGTRAEHLLRDSNEEWLGSVQVRQLSTSSNMTLKKVQASLLAMTERSLVLEQMFGGGFSSPSLPVMETIQPIREPEDAEEIAQDVRKRWGLGTGPLPKLVSLFEARGVRIFESFHDDDIRKLRGCSALVWILSASWPEIPVIVMNGTLSGEEKRFVLCHELAHMVLPSCFQQVLSVKGREKLANWFASALLLPTSALRDQLGRKRSSISRYELEEVKRQFGISNYWILRRCWDVGILSKDTYQILHEQNQQSVLAENPEFTEWTLSPAEESSTRLKRLAVRAVAEGITSLQEAANMLGVQQDELDQLIDSTILQLHLDFPQIQVE